MSLENVVLKQISKSDKWLLQLRFDKGVLLKNRTNLTINEYLFLVDQLLNCTHEMTSKRNIKLLDIQVDFKLIAEIYNNIVSSIKLFSSNRKGVVSHKDREVFFRVLENISKSQLLKGTCELALNYGFRCHAQVPIGINPIAFKRKFLGLSWSSISEDEYAGLANGQWFSIRMKQIEN
ncbi:hypothetical protein N474_01130 [Pseudoalteromonas luteoviolacea CPMOR-2]|uniref:Uncharacterized protein n=1 Tax=Pseudoalteromonas luteoviolacea DSM 6061 TaxID=1365250 RepID=A0A166VRR6_9GAMM|nr:hypothetical protein [Pseudoalteromonas luteoviolacea]KZN33585.1 hypothetical protein N475_20195 [Pseudoalteromonas luteoviolacea DSM 6061]KZN54343.1 hypothetical protein N474_01130 [Pseudoalteromonas luteoviolacea CPMOR-2]